MDEELSLVGMTEDMAANSVLYGFISLCQMAFPGRLRACYLLGSHAMGEAVADSDLDVTLVFKDRFLEGEQARHERLRQSVGLLSRIPVDSSAVEESRLLRDGAVNLKQASLFLAGEDLRERIPLMPAEEWVRVAMHRPYNFMERARSRAEGEPLRYPLAYPDPRGAFHGYDYSAVMDSRGQPQPGFKELVSIAARIAAAEAALKSGAQAFFKRASIEAHRRHVNDERSLLFERIYDCRARWGYQVPTGAEDRAYLRSLCEGMLDAENRFLALYRDFLLAELERGGVGPRALAARRLGDILYPGDEVPTALKRLEEAPEPEVREAARESLRRIARYSSPPAPAV
ncbi:nucleotidyltransferase domain-containing protein [Cystobacter fuscus]|nr:nucleotidyltransferase domain-containing protein [Cystobacter fuscus]